MATNWIELTVDDIYDVVSVGLMAKANENTDADTIAAKLNNPDVPRKFNPDAENRAQVQLAMAVQTVRMAIQRGGKQALSVTANTVPPEAKPHVLYLAAYQTLNSVLNLQMVVMTETGGVYAPLKEFYKAANEWVKNVSDGAQVTAPDDPTGRDYKNAINVKWCGAGASPYPDYDASKPINLPISSVRYGALSRQQSLTTLESHWPPYEGGWPYDTIGQP